ncbi:putative glycoside hydrolase [Actinopolyspora mortivallis]|uniref:putative glycoside hydrolase n=1 Tax=Actinopolyspora mortivallis TaxID=33906 RepID=UPI002159846F|nr:putative glycoside hydrolase [Actinopolyspora mortivallis]
MVEPTPEEKDNINISGGTESERPPRRRSRSSWFRILLSAAGLLVVVGGIWVAYLTNEQRPTVSGLPDHPVRPADVAEQGIEVRAESPTDITATVDGNPVPVSVNDEGAVLRPGELSEGEHRLRVELRSGSLPWNRTLQRDFTVDATAPELETPDSVTGESFSAPVTVEGRARGADWIEVAGQRVSPDESGRFSRELDDPPATVTVTAGDRAGNSSSAEVRVEMDHPGMRAVHMSGMAWASDQLREPVLRMAREGRIDTVELDLKDESGEVQYDSGVPLAERIGADKGYFDARKTVEQLHDLGVRVVGRLVAFKDPVLAEASWKSGHRERVVQTPGGGPYNGGYGDYSFTNFANPVVRDYNVDIAEEAARLGFDDILYDYVRRPDGDIDSMRFTGLDSTPSESIAGFLQQTRDRLRGHDTLLGASVFGITVNRPESVGQNIPRIASYVDYVAPMIYPSHWGAGEYDVADPNNEPYKIVNRSLRDWQRAVEGTGAEVIPWLQDFSLGVHYGPDKVRAQIEATRANGIDSFLLWSPSCRYTAEALTATP